MPGDMSNTFTVTYTPTSPHCPHCGRCQHCGAPQIAPVPMIPAPFYPINPYAPWVSPFWYTTISDTGTASPTVLS